MLNQTKLLDDGVYYDMPEEDYHALSYLSNSGLKDLHISPLDYWAKANGWVERAETSAQSLGTMMHCALLEGWDVFEKRYIVKPDDIKFNNKAGQDWRDSFPENTLFCKEADFKNTQRIHKIIKGTPEYQQYFEGNRSEVTFIWTEEFDGVKIKCKARADKINDMGVTDLKSFTNSQGRPLKECVAYTTANYKYYSQGYWYKRGLDNLKKQGFLPDIPNKFNFVFAQSDGCPNILIREFAVTTNGMENAYYKLGRSFAEQGIHIYAQCKKTFAEGKPWILVNQERPFIDEEFPSYIFPKNET